MSCPLSEQSHFGPMGAHTSSKKALKWAMLGLIVQQSAGMRGERSEGRGAEGVPGGRSLERAKRSSKGFEGGPMVEVVGIVWYPSTCTLSSHVADIPSPTSSVPIFRFDWLKPLPPGLAPVATRRHGRTRALRSSIFPFHPSMAPLRVPSSPCVCQISALLPQDHLLGGTCSMCSK